MADDGGLSRFQRRMKAIPLAVREAVKPALVSSAEDVARTMKQLAEPHRDSGDLIDSITVTPPGLPTPPYSQPGGSQIAPENAALITVGNENVRYPHLVEYGHSSGLHGTTVPAHPFFWPAVRLMRKRATGKIKRAISKAIRQTGGKP